MAAPEDEDSPRLEQLERLIEAALTGISPEVHERLVRKLIARLKAAYGPRRTASGRLDLRKIDPE